MYCFLSLCSLLVYGTSGWQYVTLLLLFGAKGQGAQSSKASASLQQLRLYLSISNFLIWYYPKTKQAIDLQEIVNQLGSSIKSNKTKDFVQLISLLKSMILKKQFFSQTHLILSQFRIQPAVFVLKISNKTSRFAYFHSATIPSMKHVCDNGTMRECQLFPIVNSQLQRLKSTRSVQSVGGVLLKKTIPE